MLTKSEWLLLLVLFSSLTVGGVLAATMSSRHMPDGSSDVHFCQDYCADGESILIEFRSNGTSPYPTCICTTADVD